MKQDIKGIYGRLLTYCQDPVWNYALLVFKSGVVLLDSSPTGFRVQRVFSDLIQEDHSTWHVSVDVEGYAILVGIAKDTKKISRLTSLSRGVATNQDTTRWGAWDDTILGLRNLGPLWSWRSSHLGTVSALDRSRGWGVALGVFSGNDAPADISPLGSPDRILESLPIGLGRSARTLVWSQKGRRLQLHSVPFGVVKGPRLGWENLGECNLDPGWDIVDIHPNLRGAILRSREDGRHAIHRRDYSKARLDGFQFGPTARWAWNRLSTIPNINSEHQTFLFDWRGNYLLVSSKISVETPNVHFS